MGWLKRVLTRGLWDVLRNEGGEELQAWIKEQQEKSATQFRLTVFTTIYVVAVVALGFIYGSSSFFDDKGRFDLNELGDYLAGAFSPLAFLWLIAAYHLQRTELRQNTEALELQAKEMRKMGEVQAEMLDIERAHAKDLKSPEFIYLGDDPAKKRNNTPHAQAILFKNVGSAEATFVEAYFSVTGDQAAGEHKITFTSPETIEPGMTISVGKPSKLNYHDCTIRLRSKNRFGDSIENSVRLIKHAFSHVYFK